MRIPAVFHTKDGLECEEYISVQANEHWPTVIERIIMMPQVLGSPAPVKFKGIEKRTYKLRGYREKRYPFQAQIPHYEEV